MKARGGSWKEWEQKETEVFKRRKYKVGGQDQSRIDQEMRNGACLTDVPHHLNGTELSQEEFWENLFLLYGMPYLKWT